MIAGYKFHKGKGELYSERISALKWFEKNQPNKLDLYGFGWNKYVFTGVWNKLRLNRIVFFKDIFLKDKFKCYKGSVSSKREVLEKYKFSICYENAYGYEGYITEKIFDCFFAGCVPVYLGSSNISDYIPQGCFIDKRKYKSYNDLYLYMSSLSDQDYQKYLDNIQTFLTSDLIKPFSAETFAKTIMKNLFEEKK